MPNNCKFEQTCHCHLWGHRPIVICLAHDLSTALRPSCLRLRDRHLWENAPILWRSNVGQHNETFEHMQSYEFEDWFEYCTVLWRENTHQLQMYTCWFVYMDAWTKKWVDTITNFCPKPSLVNMRTPNRNSKRIRTNVNFMPNMMMLLGECLQHPDATFQRFTLGMSFASRCPMFCLIPQTRPTDIVCQTYFAVGCAFL